MKLSIVPCRGLQCAVLITFILAGCKSVYYATWEKLGVEKRDLLKKRVVAARDEQKGEATNIQNEIGKLIGQMNQSIAKADEFVKTMQ